MRMSKNPPMAVAKGPAGLNWFFQFDQSGKFKTLHRTTMVGLIGLEPMTLRLSSACSNQLSYRPGKIGGGTGTRTPDIQLAKLALYQLSYTPGRGTHPENPQGCRPGHKFHFQQKLNCAFPVDLGDRHAFASGGLPHTFDPKIRLKRSTCRNRIPDGKEDFSFLLRKEVIQPQVPLRLPCYDFIPVTTHSVGRCFLAVSARTSATSDFHDVTGGVYKARERIHGAVADAPLLAIPASWRRVAASNPN